MLAEPTSFEFDLRFAPSHADIEFSAEEWTDSTDSEVESPCKRVKLEQLSDAPLVSFPDVKAESEASLPLLDVPRFTSATWPGFACTPKFPGLFTPLPLPQMSPASELPDFPPSANVMPDSFEFKEFPSAYPRFLSVLRTPSNSVPFQQESPLHASMLKMDVPPSLDLPQLLQGPVPFSSLLSPTTSSSYDYLHCTEPSLESSVFPSAPCSSDSGDLTVSPFEVTPSLATSTPSVASDSASGASSLAPPRRKRGRPVGSKTKKTPGLYVMDKKLGVMRPIAATERPDRTYNPEYRRWRTQQYKEKNKERIQMRRTLIWGTEEQKVQVRAHEHTIKYPVRQQQSARMARVGGRFVSRAEASRLGINPGQKVSKSDATVRAIRTGAVPFPTSDVMLSHS